jgi:LysM repeat protein
MRKGLTALMIGVLLVVLFGQTAWAAPPAGPSACTRIVHIVRWGENLWRISRWYGTTVEALAYANGIVNPHCIYAGQRLFIPCAHPYHGGHPGPYYPPHGEGPCAPCDDPCADDDDPCEDCQAPCCDGQPCQGCDAADCDGQHPCGPGCGAPSGPYHPPHKGFYYIVRWGDTLSEIAWRHRVNMWSIVHANGIANPNWIYAGQRLYIP